MKEQSNSITENSGVNPKEVSVNWRNFLKKFGSLLGLIILSVSLAILSPDFLQADNIMNVARQSSINALLALGMLLPILTAGIDLSVGSLLALAICSTGIFVIKWGMNPILGILLCLAIGALGGWLNGIMLTKLKLPHPFISTLGTMNIFRGIALIITGASPIFGFPTVINYVGNNDLGIVPISFILVILIYFVFHVFLTRTSTGRYIYAIGSNKEAARLAGIPVDKVLILVYTLSGLMAGLAGLVLIGRTNSASPIAGLSYELDAIAAVIIGGASFFGGVGTVWGTLIGALIIAVLRNGLNLLGTTSDLQVVVIGIVIIAAVYVDVLRQRSAKK
mgnify:FL=1|jgi:ribose transport system permease protein